MLKSPQKYYSHPILREFAFIFPPLFFWRYMATKTLLRSIKKKYPDRILEVGCGTGFLTRKLSRLLKDSQITAIDPVPEMISIARRYPLSNVNYVVARMEDINEKFDGLVALHVYQLLPLKSALHKTYQLLENHGNAWITLTSVTPFTRIHKAFFEYITEQNINLYHPETFKTLCIEAGFDCQIEKISYTEGSYLAILTK